MTSQMPPELPGPVPCSPASTHRLCPSVCFLLEQSVGQEWEWSIGPGQSFLHRHYHSFGLPHSQKHPGTSPALSPTLLYRLYDLPTAFPTVMPSPVYAAQFMCLIMSSSYASFALFSWESFKVSPNGSKPAMCHMALIPDLRSRGRQISASSA